MSWFQDLAGKAENILNKIDQNAATVLQHNKSDETEDNNQPPKPSLPVLAEKFTADFISTTFQRSPSSSSLASANDASPKPKALSLRASPATAVKRNTPGADDSTTASSVTGTDDETDSAMSSSAISSTSSQRSNHPSSSKPTNQASEEEEANHIDTINDSPTSQNDAINHVLETESTDSTRAKSALNNVIGQTSSNADHRNELDAMRIVLDEIRSERDDARKDIRHLRNQLYKAQCDPNVNSLKETCARLQTANNELSDANASFQHSIGEHKRTIVEMQTKLASAAAEEAELRSKYEWADREAKQAIDELQQYRLRAQTNLQLKDKLIEQLKLNIMAKADPDSGGANTLDEGSLELHNLQRDRDGQREENRTLGEQLLQMRRYVDNLEMQQLHTQNEHETVVQHLTEQLRGVESKLHASETESWTHSRELNVVREEMERILVAFTNQLHIKDQELSAARQSLKATKRLPSAVSADEVSGRVESLTQSLVAKQSSLEALTAERNALRLQLERIEHEYRQLQAQQHHQQNWNPKRAPHTSVNVNDTDDAKARLPMFMQETPFDTRVSRRVKRVYSSLDGVGVQLGVFLRRYPLVRILAIFYVVLLHLWVMVVLCSSTPN